MSSQSLTFMKFESLGWWAGYSFFILSSFSFYKRKSYLILICEYSSLISIFSCSEVRTYIHSISVFQIQLVTTAHPQQQRKKKILFSFLKLHIYFTYPVEFYFIFLGHHCPYTFKLYIYTQLYNSTCILV